ncbi:ABC transporter permease subunit [Leisingera sp. D0M16]|uniref:ABC transporter permease subunit n=1 Tax=Leisingera coralii TaxID=3351347 RepID=UPI003B7F860B
MRMMRASVIDVMASDYVQMARLKGVPERRIIWKHVVPNAMIPAPNVIALTIAWLLTGVVVVEKVFNYPDTDTLGRDVFSRVVHGGRLAITVTFAAAVIATLGWLCRHLLRHRRRPGR